MMDDACVIPLDMSGWSKSCTTLNSAYVHKWHLLQCRSVQIFVFHSVCWVTFLGLSHTYQLPFSMNTQQSRTNGNTIHELVYSYDWPLTKRQAAIVHWSHCVCWLLVWALSSRVCAVRQVHVVFACYWYRFLRGYVSWWNECHLSSADTILWAVVQQGAWFRLADRIRARDTTGSQ